MVTCIWMVGSDRRQHLIESGKDYLKYQTFYSKEDDVSFGTLAMFYTTIRDNLVNDVECSAN